MSDPSESEKLKRVPTKRTFMQKWRLVSLPNKLMVIATIVIAVATVVNFGVAWAMWREMKSSGKDTQQLAQQAVNQTEILRQQLVGTLGASMSMDEPFPRTIGSDLELMRWQGMGMSFRDVGKVPATDFTADLDIERVSLPDYRTIGSPEHQHLVKAMMRPIEQTVPQAASDDAVIRFDFVSRLTKADLDSMKDLKQTIKISGHVKYGDGFNGTVDESRCFMYAAIARHTFAESRAVAGAGGWFPCDDAKYEINQALQWRAAK